MRTDVERTAPSDDANERALAELGRRTIDLQQAGASLSGHERDHLFLNAGGRQFLDASAVSGLDDPADGRSFGILDYDRDGWLDLALVNANAPMLQLFHNRIGCRPGHAATRSTDGRMVALRFVGGNHTSQRAPEWSARDGYGARVTLDLGDRTILREHRAGEGLAAQNSATMLVGIGSHDRVSAITVRWPSGKSQETRDVPAGTLLTAYENPLHSPTKAAFVRERYAPARPTPSSQQARRSHDLRPTLILPVAPGGATPPLRLSTTMATWCVACVTEIPQLRRLRAAFPAADVGMFGVPIDASESPDLIRAWAKDHEPAYELLTSLTPAQVESVKLLVKSALGGEAVPATIVTDEAGLVLLTQWGPPTISSLRALLHAMRSDEVDLAGCP